MQSSRCEAYLLQGLDVDAYVPSTTGGKRRRSSVLLSITSERRQREALTEDGSAK
jgi:hypothetical protein